MADHSMSDRPAEYVRLLERLAETVGMNEEGMLECWQPAIDPNSTGGGDLREVPCGECAPCHLNDAVSDLQSWQNEFDYWPEPIEPTRRGDCEHLSGTGVDQTPFGPAKVCRCDACGWLYRMVPDLAFEPPGSGIVRQVAADEPW